MNAKEVIDPQDWFVLDEAIRDERRDFFVGRADEMKDAIESLHKRRTSLVIYGERGIGKTSFAWQLLETLELEGDVQKSKVDSSLPLRKKKVAWLECSRHMDSLSDIIASLFNAPATGKHTLASLYPGVFEEGGATDAIKRKYGFNVGVAKAEFEFEKGEQGPGKVDEIAEGLELSQDQLALGALASVLEICSKVNDDPLVIVLDEVDRLETDVGLASLVKHGGNAQFIFVGVADSYGMLLDDHESVGRKLDALEVPGLSSDEIKAILTRAVRASDGVLQVDESFTEEAVKHVGGFPWVVQQLGYHGAVGRLDDLSQDTDRISLHEDDFPLAVDSLINSREGRRTELVQRAIGDSKTKEAILRCVAQSSRGLTSSEIRDTVAKHLRKYVSDFLRELLDEDVLRRKDGDSRYVFRDPVVRIIVRLRLHFLDQ